MNALNKLSSLFMIVCTTASFAFADEAHHAKSATQSGNAAASAISQGEIKKVSKETGKLTIKHGELKNLGMPPMTMVFQVKEPSMLAQVKAGDKVNFIADKIDGKFTVVQIELAQ